MPQASLRQTAERFAGPARRVLLTAGHDRFGGTGARPSGSRREVRRIYARHPDVRRGIIALLEYEAAHPVEQVSEDQYNGESTAVVGGFKDPSALNPLMTVINTGGLATHGLASLADVAVPPYGGCRRCVASHAPISVAHARQDGHARGNPPVTSKTERGFTTSSARRSMIQIGARGRLRQRVGRISRLAHVGRPCKSCRNGSICRRSWPGAICRARSGLPPRYASPEHAALWKAQRNPQWFSLRFSASPRPLR